MSKSLIGTGYLPQEMVGGGGGGCWASAGCPEGKAWEGSMGHVSDASSDFPWCHSGCRQSRGSSCFKDLGGSSAVWMPS